MAVHVIRNDPWWGPLAATLATGLLGQAFERTRAAEAAEADRALAQHLSGVFGGEDPQVVDRPAPAPKMDPPKGLEWGPDLYNSMLGAGRGDPWTPAWSKKGLLLDAVQPEHGTGWEPTIPQRGAYATLLRGGGWVKPWTLDLGF